jgi:hypothetical protein
MKPTTLEWIDKAEGDFATAQVSYVHANARTMIVSCYP